MTVQRLSAAAPTHAPEAGGVNFGDGSFLFASSALPALTKILITIATSTSSWIG
ncbi:hypothetical protein JSQ80_06505 [Paenibacillus apiarius]|nr:hypothetical protein [Paenibacillus apiarius]